MGATYEDEVTEELEAMLKVTYDGRPVEELVATEELEVTKEATELAATDELMDFDEDLVVAVAGTDPELLWPLAVLRVVRGRGDVLATGILDSFEDDELDTTEFAR
jgi:hypothetical protein